VRVAFHQNITFSTITSSLKVKAFLNTKKQKENMAAILKFKMEA